MHILPCKITKNFRKTANCEAHRKKGDVRLKFYTSLTPNFSRQFRVVPFEA